MLRTPSGLVWHRRERSASSTSPPTSNSDPSSTSLSGSSSNSSSKAGKRRLGSLTTMGLWDTISGVGRTVVTYGRKTASRVTVRPDWIEDDDTTKTGTEESAASATPTTTPLSEDAAGCASEATAPAPQVIVDKENTTTAATANGKGKKKATTQTRKKSASVSSKGNLAVVDADILTGAVTQRSVQRGKHRDHASESPASSPIVDSPVLAAAEASPIEPPKQEKQQRRTSKFYTFSEILHVDPNVPTPPFSPERDAELPPLMPKIVVSTSDLKPPPVPVKNALTEIRRYSMIQLPTPPTKRNSLLVEMPESPLIENLTITTGEVDGSDSVALGPAATTPLSEKAASPPSSPRGRVSINNLLSPNRPRRMSLLKGNKDPSMKKVLSWIESLDSLEEEAGPSQPSLPAPAGVSVPKISTSVSNNRLSTVIEPSTPIIMQESKALEMSDLLKMCEQEELTTIDDFLGKKCMLTASKLGESTFAEVFKATYNDASVAIKILPFDGTHLVNGFPQTSMDDIYQELRITQILSQAAVPFKTAPDAMRRTNFIYGHAFGICKGKYPSALLKAWDVYAKQKKSENDRPDFFNKDQLYAVLVLENGGTDLEHSKLPSFYAAKSILFQVALSLAVVEKKYSFEHRDLHWGNILVKPTSVDEFTYAVNGRMVSMKTGGVCATIIDYTLSRLQHEGELLCVEMTDEAYFTGKGDYQFDIYRMMRTETEGDWSKHTPRTNIFWMHYLVDKMISGVKFEAPVSMPSTFDAPSMADSSSERPPRRAAAQQQKISRSASSISVNAAPLPRKLPTVERRALREFASRVLSYSSMSDLVTDPFFTDIISSEATVNRLSLMMD